MMSIRWSKELTACITVCNELGEIIEMNDQSITYFSKYGGADLCGRSLLDCHPQPSRQQLENMLVHPSANTYITEKEGQRRLIHQAPWYEEGVFKGYVEIIFDIPAEIPVKIR